MAKYDPQYGTPPIFDIVDENTGALRPDLTRQLDDATAEADKPRSNRAGIFAFTAMLLFVFAVGSTAVAMIFDDQPVAENPSYVQTERPADPPEVYTPPQPPETPVVAPFGPPPANPPGTVPPQLEPKRVDEAPQNQGNLPEQQKPNPLPAPIEDLQPTPPPAPPTEYKAPMPPPPPREPGAPGSNNPEAKCLRIAGVEDCS